MPVPIHLLTRTAMSCPNNREEMQMKPTKEEQTQSREFLLNELKLKPDDKVYTILRHVSRSGMSRRISTIYIKKVQTGDIAEEWNGEPLDITPAVSRLLDYPRNYPHDGMRVDGCGMDMGFEVVYNLGRVLFPDGFKVDGIGRNGDRSGWDKDGGYALKQEWL